MASGSLPKHAASSVELAALLASVHADASLAARLDGIEELVRAQLDVGWLRRPAPIQVARLRHFASALAAAPTYRERLRTTIASLLRDTSAVALFAEAGIPSDRGLASETLNRLARRLLPRPPDDDNLERFVSRIFRRPRDCAWIALAPIELFVDLGAILGDIWGPIREAMADAVALLATRISALGLGSALRERAHADQVRDSPFFRIPHVTLEEMPRLVLECRAQLRHMHERLETTGVSTDVVYCIDTIRRMLQRIEQLLPFLARRGSALDSAGAARTLLGALTAGRIADESLRQLGRQNLGLLAKKVIERVGHTGEHYVTSTRREYWRMLVSAVGGGAVVGLTILGKFTVKAAELAPFLDGLLVSADYAGTFILMQLLGFTLATKQPSMTAAALAATIKVSRAEDGRLDDLVGLIARIARSQFAAAVGNIITVVPVAIVLDLLWTGATGHHFFNEHVARHALDSIDPHNPSTLVFGAVTGVLLWISSLGAGWLENWVTYRRLPEALRHHRLGRVVGRKRMDRLAGFVTNQSAGIGGNITLGLLFGMLPNLGGFFGVPLDSRHITISTGMLAFAACSLGTSAVSASSCLGIALIGLLNFGVSFALALAVAFRAREVTRAERLGLAVAVLRSFIRHPLRFLFPPRGPELPSSISIPTTPDGH